MAVLIEGISVVVRCEKIVRDYKGGADAFAADVPNASLRADGELACVTFMNSNDARQYAERLQQQGLVFRDLTGAADFVAVDQITGLCVPCKWALFGRTYWNGDPNRPIAVCATNFLEDQKVVVPNGWAYERSLSASSRFVEDGIAPENLDLVGRELGLDVYEDRETGQKFYAGRTTRPSGLKGPGSD